MFCMKCGKEIVDDDALFCPNCGAPLKKRNGTLKTVGIIAIVAALVAAVGVIGVNAGVIDTDVISVADIFHKGSNTEGMNITHGGPKKWISDGDNDWVFDYNWAELDENWDGSVTVSEDTEANLFGYNINF